MESSRTILVNLTNANAYGFERAILIPGRQDETTLIKLEVVVVPTADENVAESRVRMEGQGLFWLIALIYLLLVFGFYFCVYFVLRMANE